MKSFDLSRLSIERPLQSWLILSFIIGSFYGALLLSIGNNIYAKSLNAIRMNFEPVETTTGHISCPNLQADNVRKGDGTELQGYRYTLNGKTYEIWEPTVCGHHLENESGELPVYFLKTDPGRSVPAFPANIFHQSWLLIGVYKIFPSWVWLGLRKKYKKRLHT